MTTNSTPETQGSSCQALSNETCHDRPLPKDVTGFKEFLRSCDCCEKDDALPDLFSLISEEDREEKQISALDLAAPIIFKNIFYPSHENLKCDEELISVEPLSEKGAFSCMPQAAIIPPILSMEAGMSTPPLQSALSPEVYQLFETLASSMIILYNSGEKETTLILDAPKFSSSPFFGTAVTIKEYCFAPKAYNVYLSSSTAAVDILQARLSELLATFESGNFHFKIHRLETEILYTERPFFHRKPAASNQDQESDGRQ
ncbi:MAG TPA: hypothetical protein VJ112_03890 [Rhabdochlamydiaceae bacterium]|nr:hypothetical protein [Rhabdochlamydiaceae bacterium]